MYDLSISFADLLPGIAVKLGAAVLAGLILGLERERKDKPAGLRTIVLIAVGAALYMVVSGLIPYLARATATASADFTEADPGRVAAQVVTGVGFLGAGTIIQARGSVQGLTTAAVIWVSAALGLLAGLGFGLFAVGLALVVVLVLIVADPIRAWVTQRTERAPLTLRAPNDSLTLRRLMGTLVEAGTKEEHIEVAPGQNGDVRLTFRPTTHGAALVRLLDGISKIDGVHGVEVHPADELGKVGVEETRE